MIEERWDEARIAKLERLLASHVGPFARIAIKRSLAEATDSHDLLVKLAGEIQSEDERIAFLADASRLVQGVLSSGNSAVSPHPSGDKHVELSADECAIAENRLADYLGPISSVLVKRAALRAVTRMELYLLLAEEILDPSQREDFLRHVDSNSPA